MLLGLALPLPDWSLQAQTTAAFKLDNDFFDFWQAPSKRPDREYTQGAEVSVRWPAATGWPLHLTPGPKCTLATPLETPCAHWVLSLGQDIYTPSVDSPSLIPGQRPYAGWLYLALSKQVESARRFDVIRLETGVTGPPSLAKAVQIQWHQMFGYHKPLGWDGQLPFEPAFALSYTGARALTGPSLSSRSPIVAPVWDVTFGTLRSAATLGLRGTIGSNAPPPWPATLRRRQSDGRGVYLVAGLQGELVARDLFLDGTLFRASPAVDRRLLVGQLDAGIGLTLGRVRLEWSLVHRTREYHTQPDPHTYARIQFSWE